MKNYPFSRKAYLIVLIFMTIISLIPATPKNLAPVREIDTILPHSDPFEFNPQTTFEFGIVSDVIIQDEILLSASNYGNVEIFNASNSINPKLGELPLSNIHLMVAWDCIVGFLNLTQVYLYNFTNPVSPVFLCDWELSGEVISACYESDVLIFVYADHVENWNCSNLISPVLTQILDYTTFPLNYGSFINQTHLVLSSQTTIELLTLLSNNSLSFAQSINLTLQSGEFLQHLIVFNKTLLYTTTYQRVEVYYFSNQSCQAISLPNQVSGELKFLDYGNGNLYLLFQNQSGSFLQTGKFQSSHIIQWGEVYTLPQFMVITSLAVNFDTLALGLSHDGIICYHVSKLDILTELFHFDESGIGFDAIQHENYLYVAADTGIDTFYVNPTQNNELRMIGHFFISNFVYTPQLQFNMAENELIYTNGVSLYRFDIGQIPGNPLLLETVEFTEFIKKIIVFNSTLGVHLISNNPFTFQGGFGGEEANYSSNIELWTINADYSLEKQSRIRIEPEEDVDLLWYSENIRYVLEENDLFVADAFGLTRYDINDIRYPKIKKSFMYSSGTSIGVECNAIEKFSHYIYVSLHEFISIFDLEGSKDVHSATYALACDQIVLTGEILFCHSNSGAFDSSSLQILNLSNPLTPEKIASYSPSPLPDPTSWNFQGDWLTILTYHSVSMYEFPGISEYVFPPEPQSIPGIPLSLFSLGFTLGCFCLIGISTFVSPTKKQF